MPLHLVRVDGLVIPFDVADAREAADRAVAFADKWGLTHSSVVVRELRPGLHVPCTVWDPLEGPGQFAFVQCPNEAIKATVFRENPTPEGRHGIFTYQTCLFHTSTQRDWTVGAEVIRTLTLRSGHPVDVRV